MQIHLVSRLCKSAFCAQDFRCKSGEKISAHKMEKSIWGRWLLCIPQHIPKERIPKSADSEKSFRPFLEEQEAEIRQEVLL